MSEHIEVEFAGDTIVAGVAGSAKAGDHVSVPKRFHAALLRALVEQAGGVEVTIGEDGLLFIGDEAIGMTMQAPGTYKLVKVEAPE